MDLALVEKLAPNAKFVKADYNASVKNKQLSRLPKDTARWRWSFNRARINPPDAGLPDRASAILNLLVPVRERRATDCSEKRTGGSMKLRHFGFALAISLGVFSPTLSVGAEDFV